MFAAISSRVRGAVEPLPDFPTSASFVNLSLILFNCIRGGNMMCTSGSRHWGSCKPATVSGESTRTGISWVMMVSRLPPLLSIVIFTSSSSFAALVGNAGEGCHDAVTIVRASIGRFSFFVRRIWADVAFVAVLRARLSGTSGTSRLMTLFAADWILYVSKMVSFAHR